MYVSYYNRGLILNRWIRNENMQLKVRKYSTKILIGGKKEHFPNYVQLNRTTEIFCEKSTFSVGYTELLS